MKRDVDDETIEYVSMLAQLELAGEEKEQVREDMGRMLDYMDTLKELDDWEAEPLCHVFPVCNVFREDVVTNGDAGGEMLQNAPHGENNLFTAPRTF